VVLASWVQINCGLVSVVWLGTPPLLTTAGRAIHRPAVRQVEIQLSTRVLDTSAKLWSTLAHEMCHAAVWLIDERVAGALPERNHHGQRWSAWVSGRAALAGKSFLEEASRRCGSTSEPMLPGSGLATRPMPPWLGSRSQREAALFARAAASQAL